MTLIVHSQYCKACGLCIDACPRGALALSGRLNEAGYEYVGADTTKCVLCGLCYTVCPDVVFEITEEHE